MRKFLKPGTVLSAVAVVFAMSGTAVAGSLITSNNIKDGTIQTQDVGAGEITMSRLSPGVRAALAKAGQPGKDGVNGTNGVNGAAGAKGHDGANGSNGVSGKDGKDGSNGRDGVGTLPHGFNVTSNLVGLTTNGVEFGPFANGGSQAGSLRYTGMNGVKLSDIENLTYTAKWNSNEQIDVGVPYLRVFVDGKSIIFSPNTQPNKDTAPGQFHTWDVTSGVVRYDDDCGDGFLDSTSTDGSGCTGTGTPGYGVNGADWDQIVADHGEERISRIVVSSGYSYGTNLTAMLSGLTVNNQAFDFTS